MQFNSGGFLVFFPVTVFIYFLIPDRAKKIWLLLSSYFFYMCWNPKYALLLLFSTLVTYLVGLFIEDKGPGKKTFLISGILINISLLFYFKYINFFLDLLREGAAGLNIELNVPTVDVVLPVGISFFIFQALGYIIDVYRGDVKAERSFITYALFVSFFPQLVAGPIERSGHLIKQLKEPKKFTIDNAESGLRIMLWGYFLKLVIADRCAVIVDAVYADYSLYGPLELILATALFSIQIYCDFMGYSTIAKGAARVLGIDLMDNFHQPFFAVSVKDFWRRWHISLSTWFRDYLYIPLGGNRKGKLRSIINLLITFTVSGLWHGANLTFVLWGLLNGVLQVIEGIILSLLKKIKGYGNISWDKPGLRVILVIKNLVIIELGFVIFRAQTVSDAFMIFRNVFTMKPAELYAERTLFDYGLNRFHLYMLIAGIVVLFVISLLREMRKVRTDWLKNGREAVRVAICWVMMVMIVFSLDISGKEFIYFRF